MAVNVVATPVTLAWSNFRVVDSSPDLTGDEVAQIHPEVRMPSNIQTVPAKGSYTLNSFTVTVAPVQQDTIVLSSAAQTADLLKHEQGHYDLMILVARAMARELGAASDASSAGLATKVQNIRQTHDKRAQIIDSAYDVQTGHGQNAAAQTAWNMAIAAALGNPASTTVKGLQL
jgi:Bacterial protein of unknown function (DUF922)